MIAPAFDPAFSDFIANLMEAGNDISAVPADRLARLFEYQQFLEAKIRVNEETGLSSIDPDDLNPRLRPFTRDIVAWALRLGSAAIFSRFGLHKTVTQLEIMRQLGIHEPGGYRLIVIPLGVKQEFFKDAEDWFDGLSLKFVQTDAEFEGPEHIYVTNYQRVREGDIDVSRITAISLDEADVLRSFGSKTFGEFLFGPMQHIEHRFVATATPSPNDFLELIAYAHFLGVLDMGEAKTRWFKRNSEKADKLTLHEHKAHEFWLWVASWAIFVQAPSDLGYSDEGYDFPPLDVRWHCIPDAVPQEASNTRRQGTLMPETKVGVANHSKIKKASLAARVDHMMALRAEDPEAHRLIWHDQEDERKLIERAVPGVATVYGSQKDPDKEAAILGFRDGTIQELAAKPVMLGGGCNFQRHCHWAIFLGIGFKFRDFIQAIHRLQRFGQTQRVRIDLIYTESEESVRKELERKWRQHDEMVATMSSLIREHGLSSAALRTVLRRDMGTRRHVDRGQFWELVCNDTVIESALKPDNSEDFIGTSIPFSSQYEYTANYGCFGHTDGAVHFWQQMGYTLPDWLRVLKPGRICAVHVKDRIQDGGMTGLKYPTVDPFHADAIHHFKKHGFTYCGMITVVTDVVRENNGTYRLTYGEMCKDSSVKSVGMPEYILIFRKPPSVQDNGYADVKVTKDKEEYSLARWQIDAHAFWRSRENRLLCADDFIHATARTIYRAFRAHSFANDYNFDDHVGFAEGLARIGRLRKDFMLIPPVSRHPDVWTDVMRARTLNSTQVAKKREKHLCPLQIDIVNRLIIRYTNPGETVWDPFSGIGTFPVRAVALGRVGHGTELNANYWNDGCSHARSAEAKLQVATLDLIYEDDEADNITDTDATEVPE